jgi:hypothetical protein
MKVAPKNCARNSVRVRSPSMVFCNLYSGMEQELRQRNASGRNSALCQMHVGGEDNTSGLDGSHAFMR